MPEDSTDLQVGTLIEQLKDTSTLMKQQTSTVTVTKENAESFVLQKAGELIGESLDLVKTLKDTTGASGDAESVESLAKLVAATACALEALNKIVVQDKKSSTSKEVKKMEIEARKNLQQQIEDAKPGELVLKGTREEIFKQLVKEANIIEIEDSKQGEQTETES